MKKQSYYRYYGTTKTYLYNQNFSADLNSYHNLIENLEFKITVGMGMLHTRTYEHNKDVNSRTEIRARLGGGLQYNYTKNINANYDILLQGGNKDFQTNISNNLSVRYNFM